MKTASTPAETGADTLFVNLGSTLAASDRQDFGVAWELESDCIAEGVLMVETYDPVIPTVQCVARGRRRLFLDADVLVR